jgi:photosystem II Psb27 protein
VTLEPDNPDRTAAVAAIRAATNAWVAKYRRDNQFSGKPSYGNTYSALNAVAGHINSFGPETPLPKKRLDRVLKELEDADKLIERGR